MKPIVLAPMAGITDKPFRKMVRLFGDEPLYTEMIGVESLRQNHPATRKMLSIQDEKDIIVQFVGVNLDAFTYASQLAEDVGSIAIGINMGCPVKKLISNGSGAALLKTPQLAAKIIETVKKATFLPVFAKMRIGWDLDHINAIEFAKTLENAGVDQLTVHARTKAEGYSGKAHWDIVQEIKQCLGIPVYVNGDIVDLKSAKSALAITNADGIMIGRGALGKPWILSEIKTGQRPSFILEDLIFKHIDLLLDYYGQHGIYIARKHIAWYLRGQKNIADFCQKVYAETDVDKVKHMIHIFLKRQK